MNLAMKEHTVAFLGLGLISGSLAGALKAAEWQGELIAWGPRLPSLARIGPRHAAVQQVVIEHHCTAGRQHHQHGFARADPRDRPRTRPLAVGSHATRR